ncbi:MAG: LysR substrate-binding domain-containing protein, partial [Telluria sp.]
LADGELDLALGIFPEAPEVIRVQDLFRERFISLADKAALPSDGQMDLQDWLDRPHVMLALRPDATDEIEKALAVRGLKRHIALALPHWGTAVSVIAGTDLILTVASRAVSRWAQYETLREFTPPLDLPEFSYQQAWHVRREADPAHRWLREAIKLATTP